MGGGGGGGGGEYCKLRWMGFFFFSIQTPVTLNFESKWQWDRFQKLYKLISS